MDIFSKHVEEFLRNAREQGVGAEVLEVENLLRKYRVHEIYKKYAISRSTSFILPHWEKKDKCFVFRLPLPYVSGLKKEIMERILEKHNLTLNYECYVPEDDTEPLEEYFYFEIRVPPTNLEKGIRDGINLHEKIVKEIDNVVNKLLDLCLESG